MKNILLFLLLAATCLAGEDSIMADRPGFSTGTSTVKPHVFNVELGYQYAFSNNGSEQSSQSLPLMVLRTGLSEKIEFDLLWDGLNIDKEKNQPTTTSKADVSVGGKYRIYESAQYNLTALGILSLPTGSSPSKSNHVDPLFGVLWDYSLSDNTSLFGTVQASSYEADSSRIYDAQAAVGASFSHTDSIGTFVEIYTIVPSKSTLESMHVIDGGVTYLFSQDVQLDFNIGIGLNDSSPNFVGFGIASRF
ncbi:MAG: transporter [Sulfurimonas sp.]|jgi:hypothetical protein